MAIKSREKFRIQEPWITVLALVSVVITVIFLSVFLKSQPLAPLELPSQYPDYYTVKGENPDPKIQSTQITSDCPRGGCINDKPATVDFDGINKRYKIEGEFSRAYLYIEALVDYQRPLTVWDDVYFRINGLGGHLIPESNTLPIPSSDISRYLYDLRSVSYYPSIKDKEQRINRQNNINLFELLRDGTTREIVTSVSSDRAGRLMKEISIYYECFEGSSCSIKEIK